MNLAFISYLAPPAGDSDFENVGLGGPEAALVLLTRALARLGHRVHVFNHSRAGGVFHGVSYAHLGQLAHSPSWDVAVLVNGQPGAFTQIPADK